MKKTITLCIVTLLTVGNYAHGASIIYGGAGFTENAANDGFCFLVTNPSNKVAVICL
ncbi:MAG: hypothetical protein ACI9J2_000484 [Saprospiraceae bacterium]|jgi:hypothetical protein